MGTVGGFLAGGRLGAAIEGDSCRCDDPGFQGFLIGAPIGAVVGAVLGSLLAEGDAALTRRLGVPYWQEA